MVKRLPVCAVLALLTMFVACAPPGEEPPALETPATEVLSYPPPLLPTPTPDYSAGYPPPTVTSIIWEDVPVVSTHQPTPTPPPLPTPLPTPVVTPIPTLAPGTFASSDQPFWIYYWFDDQIWRVDSEGNDTQLLLDVQETLGKTLAEITAYPEPQVYSGPRVTLSPSGARLALVTADSVDDASYRYSIFVYDVTTGEIMTPGPGRMAAWAPDSERLAFIRDETIQVVDLGSGETELVADQIQERIIELSWSAEGHYILFVHDVQSSPAGGISLIDIADQAQSRHLLESEWPVGQLRPVPGEQSILFLSSRGSLDPPYDVAQSVWTLSLTTGAAVQLTQNMEINNLYVSPDRQWALLNGFQLHVLPVEELQYRPWLLRLDSGSLYRLPVNECPCRLVGWSPEGRQWVSVTTTDDILSLVVVSADDFTQRQIAFPTEAHFLIGDPK